MVCGVHASTLTNGDVKCPTVPPSFSSVSMRAARSPAYRIADGLATGSHLRSLAGCLQFYRQWIVRIHPVRWHVVAEVKLKAGVR